jgi:hypothetical protein
VKIHFFRIFFRAYLELTLFTASAHINRKQQLQTEVNKHTQKKIGDLKKKSDTGLPDFSW